MAEYENFEKEFHALMEKYGIQSYLFFAHSSDPSGEDGIWHMRDGDPTEHGMSLAAAISEDPDLAQLFYASLKAGLEMADGEGDFSDDDDEPKKH